MSRIPEGSAVARRAIAAMSLWAGLLLGAEGVALPQARTPSEGDIAVGKQVYEKACADCHGGQGKGDGPKSRKLGFLPRDFSLSAFKCRCTPTGQAPADADLYRTVTNGLPGTAMASHASILSEGERWSVVRYVKTLAPKLDPDTSPACMPLPAAPPATPQLLSNGKQLYRLMQCAKCHGPDGRGDGPAAATLKDDWGRPIRPGNFARTRAFKCGGDVADLYRTLRTGLTGSPMPSFDEALAFAREDFTSESLAGLAAGGELAELQSYVARQPDAQTLATLPGFRADLVSARVWALAAYLKSLVAR